METRPAITATNYSDVYDYYEEPRIGHTFNKALFKVARALYAPDVVIGDETRAAIEHNIALGKGALLAVNHPSPHDPFVTAGAFHELDIEGFSEFTGFAKDELFRGPRRIIFEKTGCVPVFRQKNYQDLSARDNIKISERLFQLARDRLVHGQHVSLMPEGTNSASDELTTLNFNKIKSGIVKIAQYATTDHAFILPVGVYYRTDQPRNATLPRHAAVAFGEPITVFEPRAIDLRHQVHEGMQAALDMAVAKVRE